MGDVQPKLMGRASPDPLALEGSLIPYPSRRCSCDQNGWWFWTVIAGAFPAGTGDRVQSEYAGFQDPGDETCGARYILGAIGLRRAK